MLNSRDIFTEMEAANNEFLCLDDKELQKLHQILLEILEDILIAAEECGAQIMLSGGSLLGAIRHQGFIPWDDDLDLMAFRNDYEKILDYVGKKYPEKYYVYAPNHSDGNINTFAKIVKKDTLLVSFANLGSTFCNGVAVEIFPIDYCSSNNIVKKLKSIVLKSLSLLAVSATFFSFRNDKSKRLMIQTSTGKLYYYFRVLTVGRLMSLVGFQRLNNLFDRISRMYKKSSFVTVATGRKGYLGECQKVEDMLPGGTRQFQHLTVPIPRNWDRYLSNLYGDYNQIPSIEKREHHFYLEINF